MEPELIADTVVSYEDYQEAIGYLRAVVEGGMDYLDLDLVEEIEDFLKRVEEL